MMGYTGEKVYWTKSDDSACQVQKIPAVQGPQVGICTQAIQETKNNAICDLNNNNAKSNSMNRVPLSRLLSGTCLSGAQTGMCFHGKSQLYVHSHMLIMVRQFSPSRMAHCTAAAGASMTTTVKCMCGETGGFVLSRLFAHKEITPLCINLRTWLSPQFHVQYMCVYRRHMRLLRFAHDNISFRNVPCV